MHRLSLDMCQKICILYMAVVGPSFYMTCDYCHREAKRPLDIAVTDCDRYKTLILRVCEKHLRKKYDKYHDWYELPDHREAVLL